MNIIKLVLLFIQSNLFFSEKKNGMEILFIYRNILSIDLLRKIHAQEPGVLIKKNKYPLRELVVS